MTLPEFTSLIRDVGLPAAIAVFVLWKLNGSLGALRKELLNLIIALVKHQETEERSITEIRRAIDQLVTLAHQDRP